MSKEILTAVLLIILFSSASYFFILKPAMEYVDLRVISADLAKGTSTTVIVLNVKNFGAINAENCIVVVYGEENMPAVFNIGSIPAGVTRSGENINPNATFYSGKLYQASVRAISTAGKVIEENTQLTFWG